MESSVTKDYRGRGQLQGQNHSPATPKPTPQLMTVRLEEHTLILACGPVHLQGIQDYAPKRDT